MKTFKSRCLDAVRQLIGEYVERRHEPIIDKCSLCVLYLKAGWMYNTGRDCSACPNNVFSGTLYPCYGRKCEPSDINEKGWRNDRCAEFWRQALHELEKIPSRYFTPSEFSKAKFMFLHDIDKRVYNLFQKI